MKKIFIITSIGLCIYNGLSADFAFDLRRAQRRINAHTVKSEVARVNEDVALAAQLTNGDEQAYADKHASYNKALKHLSDSYPDPAAFATLLKALDSGSPADFNAISMGGVATLENPQGSFVYSLDENDGWIHILPAAPTFTSAQAASEMVENYWSALVRHVNLKDFGTDATVGLAVTDLNTMSDFRGPKENGVVTRQSFLRGNAPGELVGPYISQFLYWDIPISPISASATTVLAQTVKSPTDVNFMKSSANVTNILNGGNTLEGSIVYDPPRYISNLRDLTEYVHKDFPCCPGTNAALILQSLGSAALDTAHPYLNNKTQHGFIAFGLPELLTLIQITALESLKAGWYQKWQIHRRLRPEEFGFYVNEQKNGKDLGIHSDLMNSPVLALINTANGGVGYFLNQAYPEGSPRHPSYPAGHACFIGAAVTVLKAWFNEDYELANNGADMTNVGSATKKAVRPGATVGQLDYYTATNLTVGGELNKLASNIALGRDIAGVHYRTDGWEGMLLGEKVAIDVLNNYGYLFNEDFAGFSLTTFEGNKITVGGKRTV